MYCIINIGSNLGDRRLNLSRAMRAVGMEFGDFEMSHAVESKPSGFDSTPRVQKLWRVFHIGHEPPQGGVGLRGN